VKQIIRNVRSGESEYLGRERSMQHILTALGEVYTAYVEYLDSKKEETVPVNIDHFFYDYFYQKYGIEDMAARYCEVYLLSLERLKGKDQRIDIFRKFVGLDPDRLPYYILDGYIRLLKVGGVANYTTDISKIYIEFGTVRKELKELLAGSS